MRLSAEVENTLLAEGTMGNRGPIGSRLPNPVIPDSWKGRLGTYRNVSSAAIGDKVGVSQIELKLRYGYLVAVFNNTAGTSEDVKVERALAAYANDSAFVLGLGRPRDVRRSMQSTESQPTTAVNHLNGTLPGPVQFHGLPGSSANLHSTYGHRRRVRLPFRWVRTDRT
jgi:hypothetical protein